MFNKVLVALDGSTQANWALLHAVELCRKFDAKLIIVNVMDSGRVPNELRQMAEVEHMIDPDEAVTDVPLSAVPHGADFSNIEKLYNDQKMHAVISETIVNNAVREAKSRGVKDVDTTIEQGDPADRILDVADRMDADIIVMGSRGLGTLKGLLVGSVSQKIHTLSKCTFTSVKQEVGDK